MSQHFTSIVDETDVIKITYQHFVQIFINIYIIAILEDILDKCNTILESVIARDVMNVVFPKENKLFIV